MFRRLTNPLIALLTALALAACASTQPGATLTGQGTVVGISESQQASAGAGAAGSIGGALVGGALGSLVGGGTGQTIATGVGAVAGGVAGNQVASNVGARPVWDVSIRFEDGIDRVVRTEQRPDFRPGDKVRVTNGVITRM